MKLVDERTMRSIQVTVKPISLLRNVAEKEESSLRSE